MVSSCFVSCGQEETSQSGTSIVYTDDYQLNDRQKDILNTMNLSEKFSELSDSQKRSIQRIEQMLCYLENKYETEFVYSGYIQKGINESEKLYAYPKNIGARQTVTVKAISDDKFTDDYYDYSVAEYAEELIDEYLSTQFSKDDYRYYASTNACDIKMNEIVDEKLQWKYGASNIIFIKSDVCNMDEVEKFAVNYAKFLYEHEISGTHRINIMAYFPDIEIESGNCHLWYEEAKANVGNYCFSIHALDRVPTIYTDWLRYELDENGLGKLYKNIPSRHSNGESGMADYSVEEYFSKY
ncbi:MAG: hypothetical protein K2I82_01505 [Ruminococcus sp.]|nr:hypothetical protein [Ruminococcus sp.]